jgi:hypothetical protein
VNQYLGARTQPDHAAAIGQHDVVRILAGINNVGLSAAEFSTYGWSAS